MLQEINQLLEGFRVVVNGVDVSSAVSGDRWLGLERSQFSEDGLFFTTGTLLLLPDPLGAGPFAPNFFSPRSNFAQWKTGNSVTVEVRFGGVLERLVTGYIRNLPATPASTTAELEIPICCELVYRNTESEAGDRAGVVLGNPRSRTEIIASIASQTGWVGALGGAVINEYPINYPVPKTSGTYVQQMGAIAASAGYGLECDRLGNLRASKIGLVPPTILERDNTNSFLSPVDGSEEPREKVKAVVVGRDVSANSLTDSFVIEEIGIIEVLGSQQAPETYIRKRTTVTEAWSADYKRYELVTKVEVPLLSGNQRSLILKDITTETKDFSLQDDGKLQRRTSTVLTGAYYAPQVNFDAGPTAKDRVTSREIETWTYGGEVPAMQEIARYGLNKKIFNGVITSLEEALLNTERTEWQQQAGDRWRKVTGTYVPTLIGGATQDIGASTVYFGAQYAPPEPERHIPTDSSEEISYEGTAEFGGVVGAGGEQALFEFEYGVSNAQAEELAALHGAVLVGRHRSWQCSMPLTAEWLNWRPGAGAKIRLPDGAIVLFMIDGPSINLSANEGVVTFGLIDMGSVGYQPYVLPVGRILDGGTPTPVPPTPPVVTALVPPYVPVYSGRSGDRNRFSGQIVIDDVQPGAGEFRDRNRFNGLDPTGDSLSRFGDRNRFAVDETPVPSVLAIEAGGTGGNTAAAARNNLGLAIAGGDLTGSYPNPAIAQGAVSLAKMQAIAPGLLGNSGAEEGPIEVIAIGDNLVLENGILASDGGSVIAVQSEGVELTAAASTLNFTGAGVSTSVLNGVVTIVISGGGSAPAPFNDEFDGSTVNPAWMWTNQQISTSSVSGGNLLLAKPATFSTGDFSSFSKVPPATTEWTMTARVTPTGSLSHNSTRGLMLGAESGKLIIFGLTGTVSNTPGRAVIRFSSPTTYNSYPYFAEITDGICGLNSVTYFRIAATATQVKFRAALDEAALTEPASLFHTEEKLSFLENLDRIGFTLDSRAGDVGLTVDWVRFT